MQVGSVAHVAVHHAAAGGFQSDGVQPPVQGVQQLAHHFLLIPVAVTTGHRIVLVEHVEEQIIRTAAGRLTVRQQRVQLTVFRRLFSGVESSHFPVSFRLIARNMPSPFYRHRYPKDTAAGRCLCMACDKMGTDIPLHERTCP